MTTATQLIKLALLDIGKADPNQTIKPEDYELAVETLNDLVLSEPMIPNFTILTSSSDEITSPSYCNRWLRKALALDLSPQYGTLDSYMVLERQKSEAWEVILQSLNRIGAPQLNGNTPYGSGNKMPGSRWRTYYVETDDGILTEQSTEIIVEDGTS
jgi:hypothetical protein